MTTASQTTFSGSVPGRRWAAGFSAVVGRVLGPLHAPDVRAGLHALSDHMLKDIGLRRDMIDDALSGEIDRS